MNFCYQLEVIFYLTNGKNAFFVSHFQESLILTLLKLFFKSKNC